MCLISLKNWCEIYYTAKVVDDDPGRREKHKGVGSLSCYNSNKPVYASPGCHFGGVRGYTLMTGLLALYLQ